MSSGRSTHVASPEAEEVYGDNGAGQIAGVGSGRSVECGCGCQARTVVEQRLRLRSAAPTRAKRGCALWTTCAAGTPSTLRSAPPTRPVDLATAGQRATVRLMRKKMLEEKTEDFFFF